MIPSGLSWAKLRTWKGSQGKAFEELCCQLAYAEAVPKDSIFIRNAPPDAGVECLWRLPDLSEWGWQAKFPENGLSASLWQQLDASVKSVLSKRPRVRRYFVCLPVSLPDGRLKRQQSGRKKWESHVKKWTAWAKKKKRTIKFELWDETQLLSRLSGKEHQGRLIFWFGDTIFDTSWFRSNVQASIAQAGDRYDAVLNVAVPEAGLFPALTRTPEFWKRLDNWGINVREALTEDMRSNMGEAVKSECEALKVALLSCIEEINKLPRDETSALDFAFAETALKSASAACSRLRDKQWELERAAREDFLKEHGKPAGAYDVRDQSFSWHAIREVERRLSKAISFLSSPQANLINNHVLLLMGHAGTGKTQLLCNTAESLLHEGVPVILLAGEQFHSGDPWTQVLQNLGLNCQRDEFLGALDSAAQAAQRRAIIIIDAVNEGEGLKVWPHHLSAFLTHINHWSRISVCLSVRTGYESIIFPNGPSGNKFVVVEHRGFANLEAEASAQFFEHFGIATPSVPVLSPDFSNPLFLKLFCRALQNANLTEVPTGLHGITSLFDFFLNTINDKLARPASLDFDPAAKIVQKAVDRLAELMVLGATPMLPLDQVQKELEAILPRSGYQNSLERHLRVEGVIARQMDYDSATNLPVEAVRFTYQRFTDHKIVRSLIKDIPKSKESTLFAKDSPLNTLLIQKGWYWQTQGLWDALAIQLPETHGVELPDLNPKLVNLDEMRAAFLASIVWRNRKCITGRTRHWLITFEKGSRENYAEVIDALLSVCTCRDHPLNADYLAPRINGQTMPDRDAEWSIFVFNEYGNGKSLDRLIDWAVSENAHSSFDSETLRLAATILIWIFTTSHRFARDRATKALVSLLKDRLSILRALLKKFSQVDDMYVLERVYAAAYGCALCTQDLEELAALAQDIYNALFRSGSPPADILVRDYARGIIQLAHAKGLSIKIDSSKIIPPYQSNGLDEPPSLRVLEKHFKAQEKGNSQYWRSRVIHSVTGDDFSHYEMSDLHKWSPRRRDGSSPPSKLQIYNLFTKSLSDSERSDFKKYATRLWEFNAAKRMRGKGSGMLEISDESLHEWDRHLISFEKSFAKTLRLTLRKQFTNVIVPMLRKSGEPRGDDFFPKEFLQRWIIHRVLQLGWTAEKFGEFDDQSRQHDSGRSAHKPERIGKKYQWIALREFFARLSDNFEFTEDYYRPSDEEIRTGRWTNEFRDIDPSLLVRSTPRKLSLKCLTGWWNAGTSIAWRRHKTKTAWMKDVRDLPDPKASIAVTNPEDGSEWLLLNRYQEWAHSETIGHLGTEKPERQELFYMFKSYLVRAADFASTWNWAKKEVWTGRWMPESHSQIRVCLHEFYWPPQFDTPLNSDWSLERTKLRNGKECPLPLLITNDEYLCEKSTYDCSIDETISLDLPSRLIVKEMQLQMLGRYGEFYDSNGLLVAFDTSTMESGYSALLIRKQPFVRFLAAKKLRIFWTIVGEKNYYPLSFATREQWDGRLEISGSYSLSRNGVEGAFTTCFTK
jgi:hypothetical protein